MCKSILQEGDKVTFETCDTRYQYYKVRGVGCVVGVVDAMNICELLGPKYIIRIETTQGKLGMGEKKYPFSCIVVNASGVKKYVA